MIFFTFIQVKYEIFAINILFSMLTSLKNITQSMHDAD